MEFLSMNVGKSKVNGVIKVVLRKLAGKETDRLPSNAVKSQLLIEARHSEKVGPACMGVVQRSITGIIKPFKSQQVHGTVILLVCKK